MLIPVQNEAVIPNAVYCPQMAFNTGFINGKMVTSATMVLGKAKVENADTEAEFWTPVVGTETVYVPDIMNLPEDLISFTEQVRMAFGLHVQFIVGVNTIRKVV